MSSPLSQRLEQTLRHEIPLTGALGLRVESWEDRCLALRAPLEPNLNHKCTAFGGSLYSLAVLTGWGWLWCVLQEERLDATIVIQHSRMDYRAPVDAELRARCAGASDRNLERFLRTLRRRGRARLDLDVAVEGADGAALRSRKSPSTPAGPSLWGPGDDAAAEFRGCYVVLANAVGTPLVERDR